MRSRRRLLAAAGFLYTFIALSASHATVARPAADAALRDLRGVEELKAWFNTNSGHARLILLLSPT
ncbi:MAG: hypothetical protein DMF91_17375 [Acidobacteria bacterium]|nr:MAG: hypothetical protein DMF91_17375 [Acidobacteriota bacterium]